jgi:hypothetical protein
MNSKYVSYDIKGIQKAIFSVSRLLSIVGGSALIDSFDRETVKELAEASGNVRVIFSGGGKGVLETDSNDMAESLKKMLVKKAFKLGLSLRTGISSTLNDAMKEGDELYPYIPEDLEGHPCRESGLYPVTGSGIHPIIQQRIEYGRQDKLGSRILELMIDLDAIPEKLRGKRLAFIKTLDPADGPQGKAGEKLFSARNRWAVVSMDGNDLGRQFRECKLELRERSEWARKFSKAIAHCTENAFALAMGEVLEDYIKEDELPTYDDNGCPTVLIPFRPLILGGDDVLLLTHTSLAMPFARLMTRKFEELTLQAHDVYSNDKYEIWPANKDGKLRISSGIVYIGTSYPLHAAIDYADALLGGAKAKFRSKDDELQPTPSAVDWESITENFIDNTSDRRFRELVFEDMDLDGCRIELTRRPYTIDDLERDVIPLKEKLRTSVARSITSGLLENLRKPWSERVLFLSSFSRQDDNRMLAILLDETNPSEVGDGWHVVNDKLRSTIVPDVLLLLEEEHRISSGGSR